MDKIKQILSDARNSISDYCINNCNALCCKTEGLILLNDKEIDFICGNKKCEYLKNGILSKTKDNNYKYDLEKKSCKHLGKDFKCSNHHKNGYPRVCSDYPIFIVKGYIITSSLCLAVVFGKLDLYIKNLEKLGLKKI